MWPLMISLNLLAVPLAYIGPGAGFALGGSFLFAFAGILLAVVAVLPAAIVSVPLAKV